MNLIEKPKNNGFTLVELLVVIVVIAALAAITLSVSQRMMNKAHANQAMQNLHQIGATLATYASDHSMKLPAANGPAVQADGSTANLQWNEVCLAMIYPDTPPEQFKNAKWWDNTKSFMKNPMFKDKDGWTPLNPGYAMNLKVPENVALAQDAGATPDPLLMSVALASLPDPGHTPIIAPNTDWTYRFDSGELAKFDKSPQKDLLSEGKFPILFVDGHVEVMYPKEYTDRKLGDQPLPPAN